MPDGISNVLIWRSIRVRSCALLRHLVSYADCLDMQHDELQCVLRVTRETSKVLEGSVRWSVDSGGGFWNLTLFQILNLCSWFELDAENKQKVTTEIASEGLRKTYFKKLCDLITWI